MKKGYKHTPEALERIRQGAKKAWTPEKIEAQRQKNLGKTLSQEHRDKIGKGNKGKIRTEDMKEVYSQLNLGKQIGEDNPNWKGGTSRIYKNGYYSREYLDWRKKVFERDNYTCQECGQGGGKYVTAHHIKSFANYPESRFDIDNGITLCETCHSKTDNYKGRANNNLLTIKTQ